MLQDNPVKNLQYDSDLRIAQQPTINPILHNERTNITSIRRNSYGTSRIPLPVSTVEFGSQTSSGTFIPRAGYEILHDMPSAHIEQTFELNDSHSSISSDNRFIVRSPLGDALFAAVENSSETHRLFWGASRPFQMHLLDKTHQESLTFRKKFALGLMCCQPRALEVWAPPGDLLGRIVETFSAFSAEFTIQNEYGEIIYQIEGPNVIGCCMPKEAYFKFYSPDMRALKGSMSRVWSADVAQYTINIYFTDTNLDPPSKALFIGAAFLMEYLYFQSKC